SSRAFLSLAASTRSCGRPAASFAVRRSSRLRKFAVVSPISKVRRFFQQVLNSRPGMLFRISIRFGATPMTRNSPFLVNDFSVIGQMPPPTYQTAATTCLSFTLVPRRVSDLLPENWTTPNDRIRLNLTNGSGLRDFEHQCPKFQHSNPDAAI